MKNIVKEYAILTFSILIMVFGIYFFKFPNHFAFGGVTGLATVLEEVTGLSVGKISFLLNIILIIMGFLFLGKGFGIKTFYCSMLLSVALWAMEFICPIILPLTDEPLLELAFAIVLPGIGSAILFNRGASSGGTDILALIIRKQSSVNVGIALLIVDILVSISSFFIFDIKTGLYSIFGLFLKSLVIDSVIENLNLCKYFTVICEKPDLICDYITHELHRSATIFDAKGAFSGNKKTIILTAMRRNQAVALRIYIKQIDPKAFLMISNTSEIVGKGFRR